MAAKFTMATEASEIADDLMRKHHVHLIDNDVRVEFVFSDQEKKHRGNVVWGDARKITSIAAFLATQGENVEPTPEFFVITLYKDVWVGLTDEQRRYLVDHELSHCYADFDDEKEELKLSLLGHDLEEFRSVVERHGLNMSGDIRAMYNTMRKVSQGSLFDAEDKGDLSGVSSITLSADERSVTMTGDQFGRAARAITGHWAPTRDGGRG
jgi:hypothetical protein